MPLKSLAALGLAIALVALSGEPIDAPREAAPSPAVAPSLAAAVAAGATRLPVIVLLRAPAVARLPLSPTNHRPEHLRQQAIAPLLERELESLDGRIAARDIRVVRRLKLQPAFAAVVTPTGLAELSRTPAVELVEPDLRWRLHTAEGLPLINATEMHRRGLAGAGIAVAVIDTGVDPTHPALGGSALPNSKVVYGLDTADGDQDPTDCGVHGTAVAAVIAGSSFQWNPALRFAGGVAPQAKILAYKATPDADCGSFALSAVLAAMEDALLHRQGDGYSLAAINLSVGAGTFAGPCEGLSSSYRNAISDATAAGVAVVASAGNEGRTDAMAAPACLGQVLSVGSVWDAEAGWTGFSFCLDPGCTALCNDSFATARAVTCYSNSSPVLDLLAPSEYLTTARAGAQTLEFGGTSGAAAYVTGAVALLRQSGAGPGPAGLRALLELTGQPVVNRRSGRVTSLVDLARALDHDAVIATAAPAHVFSDADGSYLSTIDLDHDGTVGSLRVQVHIASDQPERLRLRLLAPDGSSVLLHDHGPGSVPDIDGLTRFGALWGTYPDGMAPVQTLGTVAGSSIRGRWTLELSGTGGATGRAAANLLDWSLEITPRTSPPPPTLVIPAVAHDSGLDHTAWHTDLRVANPSGAATAVRLTLVPSGADGLDEFYQSALRLPAGTVVDLSDVVASVFGRTETSGVLLLTGDGGPILATSRTAASRAGGGSFGEFIGAWTGGDDSVALAEAPLVVPHLESSEKTRTNLGFSEISGHAAGLLVRLLDGETGAAVGGPIQVDLNAYSHRQVRLPVSGRNLYAEVTVKAGVGRVVAYASTVDNATQDAAFIPAVRPVPVGELVLPVVAAANGRGGTRWRSDVRVANLGRAVARLRLDYRPRRGETGGMTSVETELEAGRVLASEDLVGGLLGLDATAGSLTVTVMGEPAPIVLTSRTANWTEGGSFGQFVGAVHGGLDGAATIIHLDAGPGVRSNIGVCEVQGADVRVRLDLRDSVGNPLGSPAIIDLKPFELVQLNDVFASLGAAPTINARLDLDVEGGEGAYAAYASVVDGVTGDAIFVPAQPLPN